MQIDRNTSGLIWSLILLGIVLFFIRNRWKPSFVVPKNNVDKSVRTRQYLLLGIMIVCLVCIPLDIALDTNEKKITTTTSYMQVVLDVSLSMSGDDVEPNRFAVAKNIIQNVVGNIDNTQVGLIAFSGIPLVQFPFTSHRDGFLKGVDGLQLGDFPQTNSFVGTALGDALLVGTQEIKNMVADTTVDKVMLVITDGDTSKGLDPLVIAQELEKNNVRIVLLTIGKDEYLLGTDSKGDPVYAYIDEQMIQDLADITNGVTYHIRETQDLDEVIEKLTYMLSPVDKHMVITELFHLNDRLIPLLLCLSSLYIVWKGALWKRLIAVLR